MLQELTELVSRALAKDFEVKDSIIRWERPQDPLHGDRATAAALSAAKQAGKAPKVIAEALAQTLTESDLVERTEVAGPGYVNVWLTPKALLKEVAAAQEGCRPLPLRKEKPVIIDYSQPNIAKPLGIHHVMSTVIGQVLANLHRHAGQPVLAWNYIGDWGTQFGKLAVAYEKWGAGKPASQYTLDELLELYVRFHAEVEKDEALEDAGRAAFLKLEKGDPELRAFWKDVVAVTKASLSNIYDKLHVSFDTDIGESYYEDKMTPVIEEGKKKGVFIAGEKGALIVTFDEKENMPPAVVLKADGATIYLTRDLAMMKDRISRFDPKEILFVVDSAQSLHFKQLFATVRQLRWELPKLEHVFFGRMKFADRSMSTRKGNIVKLEHVLDEAVERATKVIESHGESIQADDTKELAQMMGTGAVAYGILSQNRKMDIVFDWDKVLSFDGNSAPYLQYTHARACSVLRKAEGDVRTPADASSINEHERSLMNQLGEFPHILEEARQTLLPHLLANYLYTLAQTYNGFYNAVPILKAEAASKPLRLYLTAVTATVLKTGAELLTLRVPERM